MVRLEVCLLLTLLIPGRVQGTETQRYDGWYNNLGSPKWGSAGDDIIYDVPASYSDLTYLPSGADRPNPRLVSNNVLAGPSGLPSYANRTALFAFLGQMVAYEVIHASDSACPVELIKLEVPEGDDQFGNITSRPGSQAYMPFVRSGYNPKTGHSPNNPRKPVNKVSSWIDGSSIYGSGAVWCNCIRSFTGGLLLSSDNNSGFPGVNKIRLPMDNFPSPVTHGQAIKPEQMWMFGDPHVHQNPGLMAVALVWFRYHNHVATEIQTNHPSWTDDEVFEAARKRVIAVQQSIVVYEWLPALLGEAEPLPQYSGYKDYIKSSISVMFEAAAFRMGHSIIPPGIYFRDNTCAFHNKPIRLCNSYWHSQEIINEMGVEDVLLGISSQISEREDHVIVDDLRGSTFGPRHYSRHDLSVLTIMRGRDHGLPDYNTAREYLGLPRITRWKDINPWLYDIDPTPIHNLRDTYVSLSKLDVYPAAMLEYNETGPGPVFKHVIIDQFTRLRDGDRFWFENRLNGLFSEAEINEIRSTTFRDVMINATDITDAEIQKDVFYWRNGDPCEQPKQMTSSDLDDCTPHQGYDYFSGSEVTYIVSFTFVLMLPFICTLAAYLLYRVKNAQYARTHAKQNNQTERVIHEDGHFQAEEWTGCGEWTNVRVQVDDDKFDVNVKSGNSTIRNIHLAKYNNVTLSTSTDHNRNVMMVHVPKEYDLVVRLHSEQELHDLCDMLKAAFRKHQQTLSCLTLRQNDILAKAMTKTKRSELITTFFKSIFAEAQGMSGYERPDEIELHQCKEIVECELSRQEFAEALALKPDSTFVEQMFNIIDKDGNGYASFRELLYFVLMFAQGTCDDKLHMVFAMYDTDKSGTLDRSEVVEMIRSMLEMASTKLSPSETNQLVNKMFETAGLEKESCLTLDNFAQLLSDQANLFWDVSIDFKGKKICMPKRKENKKNPSRTSCTSKTAIPAKKSKILNFDDAIIRNAVSQTKWRRRFTQFEHYVENSRQHIVYVFIFYSVCLVCFVERYYRYAVEQEHVGLRSLTGYGLSVSRAGAAGMSFTFSLLLLTMCRNSITVLRETILNHYIPFDSYVAFHKLVAYTALFFCGVHVLGYCFNFYHVATQPVAYLCVLDEVSFRSDELPNLNYWLFQTLTGITGVLLCIVLCIIYVFANPISRRYIFSYFWITHQFFYAVYILIILHGASRLVQQPFFPYYLTLPATIFVFDKLVSISQNKKDIMVTKSELLPSGVTMLEFKRPSDLDYRSGQWIRLACDKLGANEYHSLTLTSAPHEENLSVHIRAVGPWTKNIRRLFDPEILREEPCPKLYVDGPFGAGQQDWFRYDVSICVGGGIGITPYASILKDFVFLTSAKKTYKVKCHKVYFIWVTASQKHFEWFIDILKQVEEVDHKHLVETHIFITQLFQSFDLRTTMLYIFEEHFQRMSGRSLFTGARAQTHFGRPDFEKIFDAVHSRHPQVRRVGVFSCGPAGVTKGVQQSCFSSNKRGKTRFEHHFENF